MTENELKTIIENHAKWLEDNSKGECADLCYENLSGANLSGVNLSESELNYANLSGANLSGANFNYADLSGADLSGADLSGANFNFANLHYANLSESELNYANLNYANLSGANLSGSNLNNIKAWNTVGNGKEIKSFQTEKYTINIINDKMVQIGCEQHSFDDWTNFDDETIDQMDTITLDWWKTWKPILKALLDNSK